MSLLFAVLFTAIGNIDLYISAFAPSFDEPTPITLRVPYGTQIVREATDGTTRLLYEHTRVVIPRGTVLREADDEHRAAFAYESTRRPFGAARLISSYVIYFIVGLMLTAYLRRFGQNRVRLLRPQIGLFVLITASLALGKAMLLFTALPEFWIPVAALPLWVALAFDRRTAFLVEVCVAFIAASLLRFDLILLSVLLIRGITATLFFFSRRRSRAMLIAGTLAGLSGAVAFVALTILFEGTFQLLPDLMRGAGSNLIACFGGGVLGGIVARGLHEPAERIIGHVSRDKLLDLTDLENPLLKKMAAQAPGSWEHARAMANLAEAAAAAIGADALLTRVGAYYHDLGKTVQPKYFVENLLAGETTPHDDLDPEVSADAIMAHVVLGTKILRDGDIPEPVVEFAYTHHGTLVIEYFWHKCLEQGNPKELSQSYFRYPGMKPQTKETAILMLVDSIEAASRTIWPPEQKKFEEMIQRVVFSKLGAGQLDQSGLSIEDLRIMTGRMASTLVNMYHGRIKYPWQRESEKAADRAAASAASVKLLTAGELDPKKEPETSRSPTGAFATTSPVEAAVVVKESEEGAGPTEPAAAPSSKA